MELSTRLKKLPPYLFAEIDKKKKAAVAAGRDVINLGIGDPDMPTPGFVIDALAEAARDPATHRYALDNGDPAFRRAIAEFMKKRYGVELDPDSEIYPTIGSKEAIGHFPLAFIEPGDAALIPEPGYPPYRSGVVFAGGEPVSYELRPENGFMPDFASLDPGVRMLFLNYPNSPSGVIAPLDKLAEAVSFCRKNDIILVQDAAYAELSFDARAHSVLELDGAREVAIEFHSLSKTFNMTGWRVGWACGAKELVRGLGEVKKNLDSGIFTAVQRAASAALQRYDEFVPGLVDVYKKRRDVFCEGLARAGWKVKRPASTFYVWTPTPNGRPSMEVSERLLSEADIVMTPGVGFGTSCYGYIRAALTVPEDRLSEATERIGKLKW